MGYENVHAISFDAAGTLIFPHPGVGEIYCRVLAQHGVEADPERVEARFFEKFRTRPHRLKVDEASEKELWRDVVRGSFPPIDERTFERVFQEFYTAFESPDQWRLAGGALEVFKTLRRRSYRLVVLSNADIRLKKVFAGFGLTPFFEGIFLSTELGFEKPDLRAFRKVERSLGLPGSQILHVGDSAVQDGIGAKNAGWQVLLLNQPDTPLPGISGLEMLPDVLIRGNR